MTQGRSGGTLTDVHPQLDITYETQDNCLIVHLTGMLDGNTCPQFESFVRGEVVAQAEKVVVNLRGLQYLSSAGVSLFILLQHHKGGMDHVHLAQPGASVAEVFKLLGLDALFTIHKSLDYALQSLK